jgi:hypothetical protein
MRPLYHLTQKLLPHLKISNENIKYYASLVSYYPVRWHRHSDPPPGGQPHSEGYSVIGPDGRTVTNE